mgnify:CR=1 FL=1
MNKQLIMDLHEMLSQLYYNKYSVRPDEITILSDGRFEAFMLNWGYKEYVEIFDLYNTGE